jgi:glycosyltransferase involved in cell wall biosynthesis
MNCGPPSSGHAELEFRMKLIIQIPCFNEADTLPETLADLPRSIPGIDTIETLIVDDGSTDDTVEIARRHGVDHIVSNRGNRGLAKTFSVALDASLKRGADIIVNTDGDNQYRGADIAALVRPIVEGKVHLVVGDRQTGLVREFSWSKRLLQALGSHVVRHFSGLQIPDAVSGFRALSREAALKINIVSNFSYTIEMLLQAGAKRIPTTSVPVRTNPKTRDSRLFRSIPQFVSQSCATLLRMHAMYQPLKIYLTAGIAFSLVGAVPIVRFLVFVLRDEGQGHIQSLVIGGTLLIVGFLVLAMGLLSDLVNNNRILLEQTLAKVREMELAMIERDRAPKGAVLLQEQIRSAYAEAESGDEAFSLRSPVIERPRKVGS